MHTGKLLFAQLMEPLPPMVFERCVARYGGHHQVKSFSCGDQFLCMAFAQLTFRESLRDIEACLRSQAEKLYHLGIRGQVSRNTLANANATRDWRIYADFARLYRLHQAGSFFVTRAKKNMDAQRRYSHPVDRSTGVIFDQTLVLQGYQSSKDYPETFRGVRYKAPETGKRLLFITNNTALPALQICALYKARWQVELFFRWIKQHLRIKSFFGTSENAVKSQIWIAVSVYVLVAIVKKRLNLTRSLYEILQILSLNLFEKTPLDAALALTVSPHEHPSDGNQLILFN